MRINPINNIQSFKGTVKVDRIAITNSIALCPKETQKGLITGLNTLKRELELKTPKDKTYTIEFHTEKGMLPKNKSEHTLGCIYVTDEKGVETNSTIFLEMHDKNSKVKEYTAKDQSIWAYGFKPIADKIISSSNSGKNKPEFVSGKINDSVNRYENPEERKNMSAPEMAFARYSSGISRKIQSIYNNIQGRDERIKFDRVQIAKAIYHATAHSSDEIKQTLIHHFNALTKILEDCTPESEKYTINARGGISPFKYNNHFIFELGVKSDKGYYTGKINLKSLQENNYFANETEVKDLRENLFKPLCRKLFDSNIELPFAKDPEKRDIYSQLA